MSFRLPKNLPAERIRPFITKMPDPPAPLDLSAVFGRPGPFEVEIGFGKGRFLINAATEWPQTCFLGVEVRDVLRDYVALRLARDELLNARVMQADARQFMHHAIGDGTLQAVHFYFPDPWWKKRHHKRRIWTQDLFRDYERVLEPGGLLHLASDVEEVWETLTALAEQCPNLVRAEDSVLPPLCTTNFEDKALRDGRDVGRTAYRRV